MAQTETPSISNFPVWSTSQDAMPAGISRYLPLPTPDMLKSMALFGIPLTSQLTQQTLTDAAIQHYINAAINEVELITDLYITPVTFKEKHDYSREIFSWNFCYLKLNHPNVLHITKVAISFQNDLNDEGFVQFPLEHVHLMPQEGVIQLVPSVGTSFGGFLLTAFAGAQFQAMRYMGASDFPGSIRVEYQCGFEPDKVPAAVVELIEVIAAWNLLSTMGHLLFPFTSVGISIDGVSQSNSMPGPGYLAKRISDLNDRKNELLGVVKGYFQRSFLVDYF